MDLSNFMSPSPTPGRVGDLTDTQSNLHDVSRPYSWGFDNSVILAMPIKSNWYNKYQPRTQCQLVTPGMETRVNPPTLWSA